MKSQKYKAERDKESWVPAVGTPHTHLHSEHGVGHGPLVEHGQQFVRWQVSSLGKSDPLGLSKLQNQHQERGAA